MITQIRLSPSTPRAVYFNDNTRRLFFAGGPVREVVTSDSSRGSAFLRTGSETKKPTTAVSLEHFVSVHFQRSYDRFGRGSLRSCGSHFNAESRCNSPAIERSHHHHSQTRPPFATSAVGLLVLTGDPHGSSCHGERPARESVEGDWVLRFPGMQGCWIAAARREHSQTLSYASYTLSYCADSDNSSR